MRCYGNNEEWQILEKRTNSFKNTPVQEHSVREKGASKNEA